MSGLTWLTRNLSTARMLLDKADDCQGEEVPDARSMGESGDPGGGRRDGGDRGLDAERLPGQSWNDHRQPRWRVQRSDGHDRPDAEPDRATPDTLTRSKGGMAMR